MNMLENITLTGETWKEIPGYDNRYLISNKARVWSNVSNKFITPQKTESGYYRCPLLSANGETKHWRRARLVALVFLGDPPEGCDQVDHIDRNRTNDVPENLRWVSSQENNRHRSNTVILEQLDKDFNVINEYVSVAAANEACGKPTDASGIYTAFYNAKKKSVDIVSAYGWFWRRKNPVQAEVRS